MAIRYRCPECHQLLSIASRMVGRATQCPTCSTEHVVPHVDELAPSSAILAGDPGASAGAVQETVAQQSIGHHVEVASPAAATPLTAGPSFPTSLSADPLLQRTHFADDEEEEGLSFKAREKPSDELDLIPMVDCVFLLLVFYMITSSYALQKTIEMANPTPDKKGAMQTVQSPDDLAQSSLIVQIDAKNRITVDDVPVPSAADLTNVMRAKMQGEQKNELVVEADPRAFHETVVAVTDAAQELHFQRVRMGAISSEGD